MKQKQRILLKRLFIGLPVTLATCFLFYWGATTLSNLSIRPDPNGDTHGFIYALFSMTLGVIPTFLFNYLQRGNLDITQESSSQTSVTSNETQVLQQTDKRYLYGLNNIWTLIILSFFWIIVSFYIQVLFAAIVVAATDPVMIGDKMSKIGSEKLLYTMNGALYLGTFFPLVAASSFLCGWIAKERLSYKALFIPSAILFILSNFVDFYQTGYPTAWHSINHTIAASSTNQQVSPVGWGGVGLNWFIATCLFVALMVGLSFYGWLWARLGRYIRRRIFK